ncbi:PucR family transcriptional regulator [uncultured Tateyamaria sp.]|uniref:PucR family transcriptional regulator n=1 Tax=uncultured Tateyamaria sp. TaxID=455651 RepID=UPI00260BBA07|nr:PucR family transcriptional regulator [uncultured Tateyamaria sp.]
MTQVITRFFDSAEQARNAKYELVQIHRLSYRIVDLHDKPDGLVEKLAASKVSEDTARAYQDRMAKGGVVMLVRAGYKPLGVAKITREVTAKHGAVDFGSLTEEVFVKDTPRIGTSVLEAHPHILTVRREPGTTNFHMANWPIPLISRRQPAPNSLAPRNNPLTQFLLPLINRRKPYTGSIFSRHARMANFPVPLISHRKPFTASIFPRHARMANFLLPLISRRKPFDRTLIPRHGRMATVPIPLLINGQTGTNAIIPGNPHMANFPISLISKREPYSNSIFGRHARMANFPIGLTSRRKPFTGSIISRHGRMANLFLPLVIRRTGDVKKDGGGGFSFSKLLGLPTLIQR